MRAAFGFSLMLALAACASPPEPAFPAVASGRVVDLATRAGAQVRVLVIAPERPVGAVVLLPGGDGIYNFGADGTIGTPIGVNQLVRTRQGYAAAGYVTLLPDIARDLRQRPDYRELPEHAQDLAAVVAYARTLATPVFVVATSMGAISAAAALVAAAPDGVVITSGLLLDHPPQHSAQRIAGLGRGQAPVLLLAHANDRCPVSPPGDRDRFRTLLTGARNVDIVTLTGGGPTDPTADPCEPMSYHGFWGIDRQVVAAVAAWLATAAPR